MLTLLCGADRLATSAALLCAVRTRAEAGKGGNILIVPEQYYHETERALCRAGGDTISRYAEVLSFTRLASRVSSIYGGVCEEYLDEGGRLLASQAQALLIGGDEGCGLTAALSPRVARVYGE